MSYHETPDTSASTLVLLFDGACVSCTDVARTVQAASGRIEVAALGDEDVRSTLDRLQPGWTEEPMLLERRPDGDRVLRGWRMQARLAQELGPVVAWRVRNGARRAGRLRHAATDGLTRGTLVHRSVAAAGGLLLGESLFGGVAGASPRNAASGFVSAADPVIARLRKAAPVLTAKRKLGTPDWDGVIRTGSGRSGEGETYILTLERQGQTTYLALEDPAHDSSQIAMAYRMDQPGDGSVVIRWMTPGGRLLATSNHSKDGVTNRARDGSTFQFRRDGRAVQSPAAAPAGPADFAVCFAICIGSTSAHCADECLPCALTRSPFACVKCVACAGPRAISCARRCI